MMYQAMAEMECPVAEIKARYKASRSRLYDDSQILASLRTTINNERQKHAVEVRALEYRISDLIAQGDKLREKIRGLEQQDPGDAVDRQKYSYPNVLRAICRVYQITAGDIKGPSRRFHMSRARMHLIHILTVNRPDLSSPMIGSLINRDHSTILNGRYRWSAICGQIKWAIPEVEREIENLSCGKPVDTANPIKEM